MSAWLGPEGETHHQTHCRVRDRASSRVGLRQVTIMKSGCMKDATVVNLTLDVERLNQGSMDRFFHQKRDAALGGQDLVIRMRVRRNSDEQRVDAGVLDQVVIVLEGAAAFTHLAGEVACPGGIDIPQRSDRYIRHLD